MPVTRLAQGHRLAALDALAAQVSTDEHKFVPTNPASVDARHRLVRLRLPKGGLPYRNETVAYLIDDEPRARFGPAQVRRSARVPRTSRARSAQHRTRSARRTLVASGWAPTCSSSTRE